MKNLGPLLYELLIDPITQGVREALASMIPSGSSVVDLGCGTGALAFLLAQEATKVVGVDLSPALIAWAEKKRRKKKLAHVSFINADASSLRGFPPLSFDFAVLSLILHEVPEEQRAPLLREAKRVAQEVIIADYHVPLPWNLAGLSARAIESLAGPNHFKGFLSFIGRGGVSALLPDAQLEAQDDKKVLGGAVVVVKARAALPSRHRPCYLLHHESPC